MKNKTPIHRRSLDFQFILSIFLFYLYYILASFLPLYRFFFFLRPCHFNQALKTESSKRKRKRKVFFFCTLTVISWILSTTPYIVSILFLLLFYHWFLNQFFVAASDAVVVFRPLQQIEFGVVMIEVCNCWFSTSKIDLSVG